MKLNRTITKLSNINNIKVKDEQKSSLSPSACILEVWEITKEVFSLAKKYDVESRLQRNVINFVKGKS